MSIPACTILGVGNTLWADEGLGPVLVARMRERYEIPDTVEMVDGGTQGLYLLPVVAEAQRLLIFDATKLGHAPGTVVVLENAEIDTVFRGAVSLHQTTLHDLLASARLIGRFPQQVVLVGIEAEDHESWGGGITPTVTRAMETALDKAVAVLAGWGVSLKAKA